MTAVVSNVLLRSLGFWT